MIVDSKGRIILIVGNFGDDWRSKKLLDSQKKNKNDLFGKIVELTISSKNKFASHRVIATGFRNPSGLAKTKESKRIFTVENGPEGGDELNEVLPNKDYGWPYASLGHRYSGDDRKYSTGSFPPYKQALVHEKSKQPIYSWLPSIAPSNLVELPEVFSLDLPGVYELVMGTYRDNALHFLKITGSSLISDERVHLGYRIRDLNFTLNKVLVILDDNGNIHQLNFKPRKINEAFSAFDSN